ncbi:hypothetical protein J6J34_01105 [Pseudidiomarina sp. 1ASP75-14]|uniref:hypothetical protein n=1 Tax=Pseudidiomarina terrestris TaxID=2820060 RepID=UPI00264DCB8F|nr:MULTISPECIES: hypothetical protein [unclassified Pseudidiomarina]MDN7126974.1 hypothetical protein [Pseudidiomarina sp. 1APR75-33.1]MDN7136815.1 hypothetical protein [Pseudidiomarina sp. 1ASP75-14]
MTNMFKRSLVALAIAGASTGAMAADVSLTDTTYATNEFMSTMDEILSKNIVLTLNDEYKEGDYVYLRFEDGAYIDGHPDQLTVGFGEQFDEGNFAGNGVIMPPAGSYNDDGDLEDVNKGMTLDFVAQTADDDNNTVLIYRVTNIFGDETTASNDTTYGIELDFGRFNFDAPVVVAQSGVMFDTFSRLDNQPWPTNTNPWPFDTVTSPMVDNTQLFKMGPQFELRVEQEYSGELDVWEYRRLFRVNGASHGNNYSTDDGEFWVVTTDNPDAGSPADDNASAWDFVVQVDQDPAEKIVFTLSGDNMFGWIDSANPGGIEAFFDFGNPNNCTYISHNASALNFRCDNADVPVNLVFDLAATANSFQNPKQDGEFSLSATVNWEHTTAQYTDAGTTDDVDFPEDGVLSSSPFEGETELGAVYAGEWTVNGSVTTIPYMPYSAQSASGEVTPISQIIYVTNESRDPGFDDATVPGPNDTDGPAPNNNDVDRIIWVDVMAEDGTMYGPYTLNALANPGVTPIAGEIREALFNDGALAGSGKFSLTINVADYPTNVSVYSAYNVNGSDRGWVQNDSVRTDLDVIRGNDIID